MPAWGEKKKKKKAVPKSNDWMARKNEARDWADRSRSTAAWATSLVHLHCTVQSGLCQFATYFAVLLQQWTLSLHRSSPGRRGWRMWWSRHTRRLATLRCNATWCVPVVHALPALPPHARGCTHGAGQEFEVMCSIGDERVTTRLRYSQFKELVAAVCLARFGPAPPAPA